MPVSFNNIPANLRVPLFYAEVDNSQAGIFSQNLRALLIGQRLSTGTIAEGVPTLVSTPDQAKTFFGKGSMLARMVEAFRANNLSTELWCIALDDAVAAVAAAADITITGTATAAGTLSLYIAGQRVQVTVPSGATATEVATAIAAAVQADTNLPVSATSALGVATLTARNKGTVGNGIDLRINYLGALGGEAMPAGISVAIDAMADGATDPDLADAIAVMGDEAYEYVVIPYTDSTALNLIGAEMNDTVGRWSYARQLYGHVYSARTGTASELDTFGDARNDPHVSVVGYASSPTPAYEVAAMFGAVAARALSIDPARPLQTLPLLGFRAPVPAARFVFAENQALLHSGVSTLAYEGGEARIQRAVTTYRVNAFGEPDVSFLDVTTLATLSYVLRSMRQRITQKFPRHKLANDGTRFGPGQAIVTPNIIRSELIAHYSELEFLGLVENVEAFKSHLIVERNATDPNRIDVVYPPDLVNQLRIFAVLAQFRLQFATAA